MPAVAAPPRSPAKSSAGHASPARSLAEAVPSGPDVEMQAETSPGRGLPAACSLSAPEKEFTVTLEDGRQAYCTLKASRESPVIFFLLCTQPSSTIATSMHSIQ